MQWKSLVFILATAGSALARSHGQHKHRHGVRHEHEVEARALEATQDLGGFFDLEPITVTETAWECCTTSSLSTSTPTVAPTVAPTSTEVPTEAPVETPTETPVEPPVETSTSTPVPTETEPTSTATPVPTEVPEPEPETSTSTIAPTTTTALASSTTALESSNWTDFPSGDFCFDGFGGRTEHAETGNKFTYEGNVGVPWGSNILEVSAAKAAEYKYVVQFHGSKTDTWTVVIWNKIGPDMKMTGWYGNSAVSFTLEPNEIRYVAFDEDSQGSWGAAKGDSLPTDQYGGYSCTWGEFDLGSAVNGGWSGWDVSAIQAEASSSHIQGMKMCSHLGDNCSIITTGATKVQDAYMEKDKWADGIGGKVVPGPVRIVTHLDYDE
ncbi:hypothetical protein BDW59DRAFT_69941 [Aspergillus cavernicola]|uniref:Allergen Asp f 4 n=1 Tax=Aspergillus cavernicola TaxID=176166 RepID=A0ABR4IDD0_9EURO